MEVSAEFHGLIKNSRGMLTDSELREIEEFVEGRDFSLALEMFCGFLVDRNRRVPPELYVRIHSLCERLEGVDLDILDSVKAIVVRTD